MSGITAGFKEALVSANVLLVYPRQAAEESLEQRCCVSNIQGAQPRCSYEGQGPQVKVNQVALEASCNGQQDADPRSSLLNRPISPFVNALQMLHNR
eukprot:scaffold43698_cov14-Tisochrysis_lutea.AAC.1